MKEISEEKSRMKFHCACLRIFDLFLRYFQESAFKLYIFFLFTADTGTRYYGFPSPGKFVLKTFTRLWLSKDLIQLNLIYKRLIIHG